MKVNKKEIFLTQKGLDEVKAELDDLKQNVRPEVILAIKEARAQGDLSENAEYHAARDRQGHVEERIKELKELYIALKSKSLSLSNCLKALPNWFKDFAVSLKVGWSIFDNSSTKVFVDFVIPSIW